MQLCPLAQARLSLFADFGTEKSGIKTVSKKAFADFGTEKSEIKTVPKKAFADFGTDMLV